MSWVQVNIRILGSRQTLSCYCSSVFGPDTQMVRVISDFMCRATDKSIWYRFTPVSNHDVGSALSSTEATCNCRSSLFSSSSDTRRILEYQTTSRVAQDSAAHPLQTLADCLHTQSGMQPVHCGSRWKTECKLPSRPTYTDQSHPSRTIQDVAVYN